MAPCIYKGPGRASQDLLNRERETTMTTNKRKLTHGPETNIYGKEKSVHGKQNTPTTQGEGAMSGREGGVVIIESREP